MSNEVAIKQESLPAQAQGEAAAIIHVIERAALNPDVDIEKMERLLEMQERIMNRQAESVFAAAMADMQAELPSISERGGIKDRNGNVQSTYALWEDINDAIKPVLKKHGFALTFRTDFTNGVTVTGVLSHKCGHRETTSIVLPADTSGNKNSVQAIGSSVSYGKRYTASALLNLTTHGDDDDGQAAGSAIAGAIVEMQAAETMDDLAHIFKAAWNAHRSPRDRAELTKHKDFAKIRINGSRDNDAAQ